MHTSPTEGERKFQGGGGVTKAGLLTEMYGARLISGEKRLQTKKASPMGGGGGREGRRVSVMEIFRNHTLRETLYC